MTGVRRSLRIRFDGLAQEVAPLRYEIAGAQVSSNRRVPELAPFEVRGGVALESSGERSFERAGIAAADAVLPTIYDGAGWIGGRDVALRCQGNEDLCRLELEGGVVVEISRDERSCDIVTNRGVGNLGARLAVLGPGLAVALALDRCFSLHASAFSQGGRTVLLLGESGSGKSTLAATAAASGAGSRLADDVVPVMADSGGACRALPQFPQLKLGPAEQWLGAPAVQISEIVYLRRAGAGTRPTRAGLSARRAVLRLVENTVASRLFAPGLREMHLDAVIEAARSVPVSDLWVPEGLDSLADTIQLLSG